MVRFRVCRSYSLELIPPEAGFDYCCAVAQVSEVFDGHIDFIRFEAFGYGFYGGFLSFWLVFDTVERVGFNVDDKGVFVADFD